jgi:hypothetical protein
MNENIVELADMVITTYTGPATVANRNRFQISVLHPDTGRWHVINLNSAQYKQLARLLVEHGEILFKGGING